MALGVTTVTWVGVMRQVLVEAVELRQSWTLVGGAGAAWTGSVQVSAERAQRVAVLRQRGRRQVVVNREVLGWGREIALDVEAAWVVVGVDGARIAVLRDGGGLHNLIMRKLLDSRKLNAWHPIRRVPVIPCKMKTQIRALQNKDA